jgi:DNA-binding winged helix-turn-helix (wHTH) protein/tetratricopeptide (TPR) repeat protein
MRLGNDITFGRFRLDTRNECLWQGARAIALRPKAFAVLKLLVEQSGQLVTKQQVLDIVWPGTFVSDAVLKDSIRQLREALGDDAAAPTYIETAHRRGYRFIGKISAPDPASPIGARAGGGATSDLKQELDHATLPGIAGVLGRDLELAKIRGWLERALTGERQIVFVTGEAGIGKTTLVEASLQQAAHIPGMRIARGQCMEHYGAGEAYLPVLDGISRLGRSNADGQIVEILRQHAPAWLAQMPSLVPASEREGPQTQALGATRERMLREIAEALEAIAAMAPMILVLEDLHWSDYSTLDLISYLARRRDSAQLMVIGTYRPVEVILEEHPLKAVKRELQAHGLCEELPLGYLTEKAIAEYLSMKFPRHHFSGRLARMIHSRTEGNPLFMVNVVEYLVDEKLIAEHDGTWKLQVDASQVDLGVPVNVRQLIEKQIERLSPDERTVLEGASVVGMECSSVAIAAGLDKPTEWVEQHCEELARRHQFLSPAYLVELPDGTITPRHKFNHILYLEVPYGLVPPMRRSQIHGRIAERGVAIYGDRVGEIAAELAMHFEQSRDWARALPYLTQAAENATRRSAHHEATALARRGLEVLKLLPDGPERKQHEIALRITLGASLTAVKGFAAAEVEEVYAQARELFWLQGPSPQLYNMLCSLGLYYQFSAKVESSLEISDQLLQLAEGLKDGSLIMEAHRAKGAALVLLGRCTEALQHLDEGSALYAVHRNHRNSIFIGRDCKVICECFAALALWMLGYPDRATERMAGALALARELGHPQTLVVAGHIAVNLHQVRGEVSLAYERAKEAVELADEYGLELWLAYGVIELGWAEAEMGNAQKGIEQMQRGLAAYEATGAKLWRPHFLGLLAVALSRAGRLAEGLAVAKEGIALAEHSGEMYSTSELYRIQGELLMKKALDAKPWLSGPAKQSKSSPIPSAEIAEANHCFDRALTIARAQQAKSWELRLAVTLVGHEGRQGRQGDAQRALAETYSWFTEGHDTADLKQALALLERPLRGGGSQSKASYR